MQTQKKNANPESKPQTWTERPDTECKTLDPEGKMQTQKVKHGLSNEMQAEKGE